MIPPYIRLGFDLKPARRKLIAFVIATYFGSKLKIRHLGSCSMRQASWLCGLTIKRFW